MVDYDTVRKLWTCALRFDVVVARIVSSTVMHGRFRLVSLFSVVIPLHPRHDKFLLKLLPSFRVESHLIRELIIARSETGLSERRVFEQDVRDVVNRLGLSFDLNFVFSEEKLTAGENRNAAVAFATSDYVVMCDADDDYSPYRLRMLVDCIEKTKPDLLLHHYFLSTESESYSYMPPQLLKYVETDGLFNATFPEGVRNRSHEGSVPGDTNVHLPIELSSSLRIHHGHVAIRRSVSKKIVYGSFSSGEDGQYCRDILSAGYIVTFIPHALSRYRPQYSSLPQLTNAMRFRVSAIARVRSAYERLSRRFRCSQFSCSKLFRRWFLNRFHD